MVLFVALIEPKAKSQQPMAGFLITVRDVTKMVAVTHSVTGFSLVLNEIRSVTAFTPFFAVWFYRLRKKPAACSAMLLGAFIFDLNCRFCGGFA